MCDLLVVAGAPGSGKTTISRLLQAQLGSPLVDLGDLRIFHLDQEWSTASDDEEAMSFENLVFIIRNYHAHGYRNVMVNDLKDKRVLQIPELFAGTDFLIVDLVLHDDAELKRRVLNPTRDSGFRDYERAIAWNRELIARPRLTREYLIDNTLPDPQPAVAQILRLLNAPR